MSKVPRLNLSALQGGTSSLEQRLLTPHNPNDSTCGSLKVRVLRAENLAKTDIFGKADPFVKLTLGSTVQKTSVQRKNLNPTWNEDFLFTADLMPATSRTQARQSFINGMIVQGHCMLKVEVLNSALLGKDAPIGNGFVSLDKLYEKKPTVKTIPLSQGTLHVTVEALDFGLKVSFSETEWYGPLWNCGALPSRAGVLGCNSPTSVPQSPNYLTAPQSPTTEGQTPPATPRTPRTPQLSKSGSPSSARGGNRHMLHSSVDTCFITEHNKAVYLWGGTDSNHLYVLSPHVHMSWDKLMDNSEKNHGPSPRSGACCAATEDAIFVYGGRSRDGAILDDMWRLPYGSTLWEPLGKGPKKCWASCIILHSDYFTVFGGEDEEGPCNALWKFDMDRQQWKHTATTSPPTKRCRPEITQYGEAIYIHGGYARDQVFNDTWELDLRHHRWREIQTKGQSPPPLMHPVSVLLQHCLLIFSGREKSNDQQQVSFPTQLWCLDLLLLEWTVHTPKGNNIGGRWKNAWCVYGDSLLMIGESSEPQSRFELWQLTLGANIEALGHIWDGIEPLVYPEAQGGCCCLVM